jgi:iron-sulfur cluster repair protein YtfE (RIC family)
MENNIKPIKRSDQLAPLSREHHDGLLFAWKLRRGLANGTQIGTLKDFSLWYWREHLLRHFQQEEELLLRYIPSDNKLAIQLKEEHDNIRELIRSISHQPEKDAIGTLADAITSHIRFEERVLFGYLEENLSREQLDNIFNHLEKATTCSSEWTEEFWL